MREHPVLRQADTLCIPPSLSMSAKQRDCLESNPVWRLQPSVSAKQQGVLAAVPHLSAHILGVQRDKCRQHIQQRM